MSLYLGNNLISGGKPINIGVRNIGEIVSSSLPLTDAGLHLLDGSLILGGGIYQGFVDYIAELYDNTPISGYKSNVTKIGSLVDNDGVLSGFSLNNYAQIQMPNFSNASSFSLVLKIKLNSIPSDNVNFFASSASNQVITGTITSSGKVGMAIGTGSAWSITETTAVGTTTLQTNTDYWIKIEFTGSAYILSLSIDGETWSTEYTYTSSAKLPYSSSYNFNIGRSRDTNTSSGTYISGSIDLKGSYIDIDNSRWWTGAEAVKPCFCTEEQWQQSVTDYGVCGKFVYDSTNNTVRLPKVTGIIEGTTDVTALGDLVEAGLPMSWLSHTHTRGTMDITGWIAYDVWSSGSGGAFYNDGGERRKGTNGDGGSTGGNKGFQASRSWSGSTSTPNYTDSSHNNSTVQPQTIKVLYYIVIANSTKTDIQVDIDKIATDLNNKADTDLTNVNDSAKVMMSGMGMPNGKQIDLVFGASGSTYIAPATGWVSADIYNIIQAGYLYLSCNGYIDEKRVNIKGVALTTTIPVIKGSPITLRYDATGTKVLRFIYAQGSESEAN